MLNPKAFDPEELETDVSTYKTILAPNAPWPDKPESKVTPPVVRIRKAPPPKDGSKIRRTDENFQRWASKHLGESYGK